MGKLRIGFSWPVGRRWRLIRRRLFPGFFIAFGPFFIRRRPD